MRRFPCLYGKKQRMGLDYTVRQLSKYDIVYIVSIHRTILYKDVLYLGVVLSECRFFLYTAQHFLQLFLIIYREDFPIYILNNYQTMIYDFQSIVNFLLLYRLYTHI